MFEKPEKYSSYALVMVNSTRETPSYERGWDDSECELMAKLFKIKDSY